MDTIGHQLLSASEEIMRLNARVRELEKAIEEHHYQITLRTQGFDNDWVNKKLYAVLDKSEFK